MQNIQIHITNNIQRCNYSNIYFFKLHKIKQNIHMYHQKSVKAEQCTRNNIKRSKVHNNDKKSLLQIIRKILFDLPFSIQKIYSKMMQFYSVLYSSK